jgi:hypothetical protein
LWHTGSRRIIIIYNINTLLHLILIRESWPFFLGCHYACFSVWSLGFLQLFSNSPFEHLWPLLTLSSLPPGHHENHQTGFYVMEISLPGGGGEYQLI